MSIRTGSLLNGTNTRDAQSVDMERSLTNSKNQKRMSSRYIIIKDEIPYEFWCDATQCKECPVRFQCFTSRGDILIDPTTKLLQEILNFKWRLRDGSSDFREYRSERMRKV